MANVRNKERMKEGEVIASSPERPLKYSAVPSQAVPRPLPKLCTSGLKGERTKEVTDDRKKKMHRLGSGEPQGIGERLHLSDDPLP